MHRLTHGGGGGLVAIKGGMGKGPSARPEDGCNGCGEG